MLALLRLRLLGKSSVDTSSQPAVREEVEEGEEDDDDDDEEEEEDDEEEQEDDEEEVVEAAWLSLDTFCFVCVLETRDLLLPGAGALQFLSLCSPSSVHGASWVLLHS